MENGERRRPGMHQVSHLQPYVGDIKAFSQGFKRGMRIHMVQEENWSM